MLAVQNVRFDLLRLRSAGVTAVLDDLTSATQAARVLSDDVEAAIGAAGEIREAAGALEAAQLPDRGRDTLHLRQDHILQFRGIGHERVRRRSPHHGRVEPGEVLPGDARGDLRPEPPRQRILVRDQHPVGLAHRVPDPVPVHRIEDRRSITSTLMPSRSATSRAALSVRCTTAPYVTTGEVRPCPYHLRLAERDHEVRAGIGGLVVRLSVEMLVLENATGSSHRIAVRSNPLASSAVAGHTTRNPGMWVNSAAPVCEW